MNDLSNVFKSLLKQPKILFVFLFLLMTATSIYSFDKYRNSQRELEELKQGPQGVATAEINELVEKVGKLVDLPEGEDPTVATITDKEKLKSQTFFTKAENGDRVLIYAQAKYAVLYRPSTNRIIGAGPVNIGPLGEVSGEVNEKEPEEVKVAIYNGTQIAGLTALVQEALETKLTDMKVTVVLRANAQVTYEKSMVADLTGSNETIAKQVADALAIEVGQFPEAENKPEADILIIVGNDYSSE